MESWVKYFNLSLLDSSLIPVEWLDSCRNRWGTVKYWKEPSGEPQHPPSHLLPYNLFPFHYPPYPFSTPPPPHVTHRYPFPSPTPAHPQSHHGYHEDQFSDIPSSDPPELEDVSNFPLVGSWLQDLDNGNHGGDGHDVFQFAADLQCEKYVRISNLADMTVAGLTEVLPGIARWTASKLIQYAKVDWVDPQEKAEGATPTQGLTPFLLSNSWYHFTTLPYCQLFMFSLIPPPLIPPPNDVYIV